MILVLIRKGDSRAIVDPLSIEIDPLITLNP